MIDLIIKVKIKYLFNLTSINTKKCEINYIYKYDKKFNDNYWKQLYNNSDNESKNELKNINKKQ